MPSFPPLTWKLDGQIQQLFPAKLPIHSSQSGNRWPSPPSRQKMTFPNRYSGKLKPRLNAVAGRVRVAVRNRRTRRLLFPDTGGKVDRKKAGSHCRLFGVLSCLKILLIGFRGQLDEFPERLLTKYQVREMECWCKLEWAAEIYERG